MLDPQQGDHRLGVGHLAITDPVGELLLAGSEDVEELALVEPTLADGQAAREPDLDAFVGIGDRVAQFARAGPLGGGAAGLLEELDRKRHV